jgi:hypothetical protein
LPALVLLRKPLYGLAKRRKQPERYAKCNPKIFVKHMENYIDKKYVNIYNGKLKE